MPKKTQQTTRSTTPTKGQFRFSERRAKWAANRKNIVLKGTRLVYNAGQQEKYVNVLTRLVRRMAKETKREILRLFKSQEAKIYFAQDANIASQARILTNALNSKFTKLFSQESKRLSEKMVTGASDISSIALKNSLKKLSGGLTLKTNILTGTLKDVLSATITENVALIKSIAVDYQSKVQKAVMRSVTTGDGLKTLIPALEKYEGISERHAKNVALDQTRKAYNFLNKGRMQKVGLKKFEWVHSGGGQHPREDHIAMDGNIYSFDDLPVIDKNTGERGIPGQAINCGCTMVPVVEFEGEEE